MTLNVERVHVGRAFLSCSEHIRRARGGVNAVLSATHYATIEQRRQLASRPQHLNAASSRRLASEQIVAHRHRNLSQAHRSQGTQRLTQPVN